MNYSTAPINKIFNDSIKTSFSNGSIKERIYDEAEKSCSAAIRKIIIYFYRQ